LIAKSLLTVLGFVSWIVEAFFRQFLAAPPCVPAGTQGGAAGKWRKNAQQGSESEILNRFLKE